LLPSCAWIGFVIKNRDDPARLLYLRSLEHARIHRLIKRTPHLQFEMLIRNVTDADVAAIQSIYSHWVLNGTASFELEPPSVDEMKRRRDDVIAKGLPYLCAEHDGAVIGYAYANAFRPRPAYRFCVEHSVYAHPEARRSGVARLLMAELIARCELAGARQMVAVIGDSSNAASIGLHAAMGFNHVGIIRATGWKFNRWVDTVLMQRTLGVGSTTPPET
jgi:L-amino acid N-acyltransferase YncA